MQQDNPHWFRVWAEFIRFHPNRQSAITPHQLLHSYDVFIRLRCGRPSWLGIIFHFLAATLETFVPLKDSWLWHNIFAINLFKKFETLSWILPQFHQKLQVDSLFQSRVINSCVKNNNTGCEQTRHKATKFWQALLTLRYQKAWNARTEWLHLKILQHNRDKRLPCKLNKWLADWHWAYSATDTVSFLFCQTS